MAFGISLQAFDGNSALKKALRKSTLQLMIVIATLLLYKGGAKWYKGNSVPKKEVVPIELVFSS